MVNTIRRLLSLVLVLLMVGSMLPTAYAQENAASEDESTVLTEEDYATVDALFTQIDEMENAPAKKNATQTQVTDAAMEIVLASENYVEDSLERNGNTFTWWTDEGIRCIYDPRMREKYDNMVAPAEPDPSGIYNEPVATKGGWPSGNQVYLIAPYYGIDDSFTDQYKNEATSIAAAIGDTDGYTLCSGDSVTVDDVADAISNGAVVIFDSHGTTDYTNPSDESEFVTGANYSYLCLTNRTGLTTEDYNDGATYFTDSDGYVCACINGAAIANHMTKQSPAGILWMAICLGMATDTFAVPMREMGVEVVYGYSQSVTFAGDYLFEETFWDNMCDGNDVAASVAAMKNQWGNWDWSTTIASYYNYTNGYSTISAARAAYAAFPIVVSDEDAHPGQKTGTSNYGADSLQTVKSTYTLFSQYAVTAQSNDASYGTVSVNGSTITAIPADGYFAEGATVISGSATVSQNGNTFSVYADSDCTVQINFAPKTAVVVSFSGANAASQNGYAGDEMPLPTAEAPDGFKFLGWTTAPLDGDVTEKPSYYTDSFVPTETTTLYALYSYVDSTSGGGSGDYVKVTSTPDDWSGEYLIVYEDGMDAYIFNSVDVSNGYVSAAVNDNTIESNAATDAETVTIEAVSGGYAIKSKNGYIYGTSGSNKLNFDTSSQQLNTLSMAADGTVLITSNTSVLRFNATSGQYRFRYYKAGSYASQKGVSLFLKDGSAGTTYYTSSLCDHTSVSEVAAVAPSCTEPGYSAGTQCVDCGIYITGHETVDALGHSWSDWTQTTAPGCETAGEQTRSCSACETTETQPIAAVGHTVGEGTVTTAATCTTEGVMSYTCSGCGQTTTEAIPALGHSFVNGVCSACGEEEPEVSEPEVSEPVTSVELKTGDRVVIYAPAYNKALSSEKVTAASYYNKGVDITVTDGVVTGYTDSEVWMVTKNDDGSFSFSYNGQNIALGTSYSSMNLGEVNDDWCVISLGNGLYNIQNVVRGNFMEWYASKDNWSTYNSDTAATDDQFQLSFYVISDLENEPETTIPEVTEPEVTEPETTVPAGSVTELQYVFSNYTAGTQYAQDENHTLDDVVTMTINGAHLNTQVRLYAGSNAVFASSKEIDSIAVKAGYKAGTLNVYSSADGSVWELVAAQATTTSYTIYSFDMPDGCIYVKLEGVGAQVRVSEMTISVIEPSAEPEIPVLVAGMDMLLDSGWNVNFYLNTKTDVSITLDGVETVIAADELTESDDGKYIVTVSVAAAQMTDAITLREVGSENAQVYTVREYADKILADSTLESYHALVKEMLNYGGAAQQYFAYNDSALANDGITGVGASDVPAAADELSYSGAAEGIAFYGASLVYRDKVALRFYFKTEGDILTYTFRAGDAVYTPVATADKGYMIEIADITPDKLDQQITLQVTDAQDNTLSVSYGPMNYIVRMNAKGTESLQALMKALYNYHLAAKALTA